MRRLRIALLTHSTNPRGGVAHCLALGEALCALGHEAMVHAPDPTGRGFYRAAACPVVSVAAGPVAGGTVDLVRTRINDYLRHFGSPAACDFDLFHAHDGIGGNALATLRHRRRISGYVRTVHHRDSFADPVLDDWEARSIQDAQALLCVSRTWAERLAREFGASARVVGNGVDRAIYRPDSDATDAGARARWGLGAGPVVLSVGGFEARKNTATLIEAFAAFRVRHPQAQLLVVGGASLLDHAAYRARCVALLADRGLTVGPGRPVVETGPVPQGEMPALYRLADMLALPSWTEGFGLCVLEAMACGTPAIVSAGPPFTEYLGAGDALFVDPADPDGLARAMARALAAPVRRRLRAAGAAVARAHSWGACAERHLPTYEACLRPEASLTAEVHDA